MDQPIRDPFEKLLFTDWCWIHSRAKQYFRGPIPSCRYIIGIRWPRPKIVNKQNCKQITKCKQKLWANRISRANPKSAILTRSGPIHSRFSGFISRWKYPCLCIKAKPEKCKQKFVYKFKLSKSKLCITIRYTFFIESQHS